jgi:signal transduction histidine kinase
MMNGMLDVSRMEAGAMPLTFATVDVRDIAADAIQGGQALAGHARLELVPSHRPALARCDSNILRRVLANLLDNALKFTPDGGVVRVAVESDEREVRVAVSDSGAGIPTEDQGRIFDKFGQLRDGMKVTRHSSGLGLTFCKLAVEAHGGTISVRSQPGHGSTFSITVPADSAPDAPPSEGTPAHHRSADAPDGARSGQPRLPTVEAETRDPSDRQPR